MAFTPFDLTGKVAVVTGGNGGIGLGMAEGLAGAGADVVIWGRKADKNAAALEQLKAYGTRIEALSVDVSDEAAVVDAMAESLSRMGRIDTCIANAGVGGSAPLIEQTTEQWRKVTTVNLDAVFWTLREASRHMVERAERGDKGGSLLVTSSVSAIHGAPQNQAYAATKAGVLAMVRGTAQTGPEPSPPNFSHQWCQRSALRATRATLRGGIGCGSPGKADAIPGEQRFRIHRHIADHGIILCKARYALPAHGNREGIRASGADLRIARRVGHGVALALAHQAFHQHVGFIAVVEAHPHAVLGGGEHDRPLDRSGASDALRSSGLRLLLRLGALLFCREQ